MIVCTAASEIRGLMKWTLACMHEHVFASPASWHMTASVTIVATASYVYISPAQPLQKLTASAKISACELSEAVFQLGPANLASSFSMLGALGRAPSVAQGASVNALSPLPLRQSSKRLPSSQGRQQVAPRAGLDFRLPHEREAESSDLYMPSG